MLGSAFTPQMIIGATLKDKTYHFFQPRETALRLMHPKVDPNGDGKWKRMKNKVQIFPVLTEGGLGTFTCEIFGIPLMKHSPYAIHHGLVNVKNERHACYVTKEAAVHAATVRGILEFLYQHRHTKDGVQT